MTITSTLINDLATNTCTLTINKTSAIESIIYDHATRSLTFATQSPFTLTATEFIKFQAIINQYNLVINNVFQEGSLSFNTFSVEELSCKDNGISELRFKFSKANHPLYDITATYPSGSIAFANRNQPTTLTYVEFTFFLTSKVHFYDQVFIRYNL